MVDDTGFPTGGPASHGMTSQYSGTLGKVGNGQIGLSVQAGTAVASYPLDRRLLLLRSWGEAQAESE